MGLGANRAEEEASAGDAYLQFRKQRSGVYHEVSRVEVGKGVDAALVARAVVRHSRAVRLSVVDSAL